MGVVILLVFLLLAAFLAALVYGTIAFVRTGELLRRVDRMEIDVARLAQDLKRFTAEPKAPAPQPASPESVSETYEEESVREKTREERFGATQTPPPVPKTIRAAELPEKAPPEEKAAPIEEASAEEGVAEGRAGEPAAGIPAFDVNVAEKTRDRAKNLSLEMLAGTKGLLWTGVITLVVGVAFFLKYLYDLGYIDERMRLAIAAAAGAIALGLGARFRRKDWSVISQGFTGLGVAVFYVCVYFSFQIYEITGQTVSFVLACGVTALAVTLAVFQDAPSIAVLAVIGGFLSPVFISTGENHPYGLFSYLALLDLVAVGVAWFKRWRFLDALCFVGTALLYTAWYFKFFGHPDEPDMTLPATLYASVFYVLFLGSASLHSLARRVKSRPEDLAVAALNAAFWFFAFYNVLYPGYRHLCGGAVLGQAALAFLVFLAWRKRVEEDRTAHAVLLVIAMGLSVLAVPILLDLYTYQIAWAVQGTVFVYLGYRYRYDLALGGGVVAWTLGAGALFQTLPLHTGKFIPVFNSAFGSWAGVIAAGAVIALILNRCPGEGRSWKVPAVGFVGLAGLGLTCLLLTFETALFWTTRGYEGYHVYQHSSLAVLWAIIPFAVMAFLCRKRLFNWLIVAIVCYGIALVFWFLGLAHYKLAEPWIFLNTSFFARLLLVGSLAGAAMLVFRAKGEPDKDALLRATSRQLANLLVVASYVLGVYLLTLEVWLFWELREVAHQYNHQYGSLVVLWSVITLGTAAVIFARRSRLWAPLLMAADAAAIIIFLLSLDRYQVPETYLVLNTTFLARLALPVSLWVGAHLLRKIDQVIWSDVTTVAGHVVFAILAAFELWYWSERTELVSDKMALSFISSAWGLQAFSLIVIGMFLRSRTQRLLGLAFFAVTIGKVWFVDLASVEPLYRILSFIAVGLLLLPASILYQRFSDMVLKESDIAGGDVENPEKDAGEESDS